MIVIAVYGVFFVVVGLFLGFKNRRGYLARGWVRALPLSTIRAAHPGPKVKIGGRVVPSEQGSFASPCTGRDVVWARVRMERLVPGSQADVWHVINEIERGREFFVEDELGARARIVPRGAFMDIDPFSDGMKILFQHTPHMDAFCASEGIDRKALDLVDGQLRFTESVVLVSGQIYVAGSAHRLPAMPTAEGYRDSAGATELVLRAADDALTVQVDDSAEIVVTNVDEVAARKRFVRQATISITFVIAGLAAIAGAVYKLMPG